MTETTVRDAGPASGPFQEGRVRAVGELAARIVEAAEAGDLVMVRVMARALGELVTGALEDDGDAA